MFLRAFFAFSFFLASFTAKAHELSVKNSAKLPDVFLDNAGTLIIKYENNRQLTLKYTENLQKNITSEMTLKNSSCPDLAPKNICYFSENLYFYNFIPVWAMSDDKNKTGKSVEIKNIETPINISALTWSLNFWQNYDLKKNILFESLIKEIPTPTVRCRWAWLQNTDEIKTIQFDVDKLNPDKKIIEQKTIKFFENIILKKTNDAYTFKSMKHYYMSAPDSADEFIGEIYASHISLTTQSKKNESCNFQFEKNINRNDLTQKFLSNSTSLKNLNFSSLNEASDRITFFHIQELKKNNYTLYLNFIELPASIRILNTLGLVTVKYVSEKNVIHAEVAPAEVL